MGHAGSHANAGGQVAIAFNAREDLVSSDDAFGALGCSSPQAQAVAFSLRGREGGAMPEVEEGDVAPAIRAANGGSTRPFVAFQGRGSNLDIDQDVAGTLGSNTDRASGGAPMLVFDETQITSPTNRSQPTLGQPSHPLTAKGRPPTLASPMAVRRITVVEAERLQGFRDNATLIRWRGPMRKGDDHAETVAYLAGHGFAPNEAEELARTPDGPRYKAIGNSWPVTVARWIGERIEAADTFERGRAA
jgi:DNA (cytosine-5)-methyltransferase 1